MNALAASWYPDFPKTASQLSWISSTPIISSFTLEAKSDVTFNAMKSTTSSSTGCSVASIAFDKASLIFPNSNLTTFPSLFFTLYIFLFSLCENF